LSGLRSSGSGGGCRRRRALTFVGGHGAGTFVNTPISVTLDLVSRKGSIEEVALIAKLHALIGGAV